MSRRTGEVWQDRRGNPPAPARYRRPQDDPRPAVEFEMDCWPCGGTGYYAGGVGQYSGPCRCCGATGLTTFRGYPKVAEGEMDTQEAGARGGRKVREERGAEFFREIGRLGGQQTLARRGPGYFKHLAERRWAEHNELKADLPATLAEQAEDPDGDG